MHQVQFAGEEFVWSHIESISEIDESEWDACADGHPIVRHSFFRALEVSGSIGPNMGVVPGYFVLRDAAGTIAACVPTALKWGNLREFGPEIHWLQPGLTSGSFHWPKFQACSPLFPRLAPKLLIHPRLRSDASRAELIRLLHRLGADAGFSVLNLMHIPADEAQQCAAQGALISHEFRSYWTNPGVSHFEDYVALLPARKRRMLRRERARVDALGLTFAVRHGSEVSAELIGDFYDGFAAVCNRHGGRPWLPQTMFEQLCRQMPDAVRLFTAHSSDRYVAGVFCFQSDRTLFVDTWSSPDEVPGLSFEMLCYRPMEYAIEHGLADIDAGLSITYKELRGYTRDPVFNAHWFYDEQLAGLARSVLMPSGSEAQRLLDIGEQVDGIFDADRESHQVVGNLQL